MAPHDGSAIAAAVCTTWHVGAMRAPRRWHHTLRGGGLLRLYEAGITLIPGTDNYPGLSYHGELEIYARAGILVAVERLTYDRAAGAVTYRSGKSEGPTAGTETGDSLEVMIPRAAVGADRGHPPVGSWR